MDPPPFLFRASIPSVLPSPIDFHLNEQVSINNLGSRQVTGDFKVKPNETFPLDISQLMQLRLPVPKAQVSQGKGKTCHFAPLHRCLLISQGGVVICEQTLQIHPIYEKYVWKVEFNNGYCRKNKQTNKLINLKKTTCYYFFLTQNRWMEYYMWFSDFKMEHIQL